MEERSILFAKYCPLCGKELTRDEVPNEDDPSETIILYKCNEPDCHGFILSSSSTSPLGSIGMYPKCLTDNPCLGRKNGYCVGMTAVAVIEAELAPRSIMNLIAEAAQKN
jgi:hypothetical protein